MVVCSWQPWIESFKYCTICTDSYICNMRSINGHFVREKSIDDSENWMLKSHIEILLRTNSFNLKCNQNFIPSANRIGCDIFACVWLWMRHYCDVQHRSLPFAELQLYGTTISYSNLLNCTPFLGRKLNSIERIIPMTNYLLLFSRNAFWFIQI